MKDLRLNERTLRPGKGDTKWRLLTRATGTTNALQQMNVESRLRALYARVHSRDRDPGPLGKSLRRPSGEDADESFLASMRVSSATLYSSWERCTRFCSDGDLEAHEKKCHAARLALRNHPIVAAELYEFWEALEAILPRNTKQPGKGKVVHIEHFITLQKKIHKALVGPDLHGADRYDDDVAHAAAEADWELDILEDEKLPGQPPEQVMKRGTFLDSMFQICDTWTFGTTPAEYAAFLRILFEAITKPESNTFRRIEDIDFANVAEQSQALTNFQAAAERRSAPPRPLSAYGADTVRSRSRLEGIQEMKAEEAAQKAFQEVRAAKWAAKLKEMQSDKGMERSAKAAALHAVGGGGVEKKKKKGGAGHQQPASARRPAAGFSPPRAFKPNAQVWYSKALKWFEEQGGQQSPPQKAAVSPTSPISPRANRGPPPSPSRLPTLPGASTPSTTFHLTAVETPPAFAPAVAFERPHTVPAGAMRGGVGGFTPHAPPSRDRPMTATSRSGGIEGRFRHPTAAFILDGPESISKLW